MRNSRWSRLLFLPILLMVLGSSCPTDDDTVEVGALVGQWDLTALSAHYNRVVALPATWTDPDSFSVSVHWDLGSTILQAADSLAELHLFAFREGDVLLDSLVVLPNAAALTALGIQMQAEFFEDDTYTLGGSYPTLRLDEQACRTALTVAPIQDAGSYVMNYNTDETGGTLSIVPSAGDQVLPPFDDAPVTFSGADGTTMDLDFLDLDAHDTQFPAAGHTWVEADLRVTMGVADLPVNPAGAFDEFGATTNDTAYIMDAELADWSFFFTWYALNVKVEIEYLFGYQIVTSDLNQDGAIDEKDAVTYIFLNRLTGTSVLGVPYLALIGADGTLTDDSAADVTAAGIAAGAGGKLKFVVNAVCIPINETIDFTSTWSKVVM